MTEQDEHKEQCDDAISEVIRDEEAIVEDDVTSDEVDPNDDRAGKHVINDTNAGDEAEVQCADEPVNDLNEVVEAQETTVVGDETDTAAIIEAEREQERPQNTPIERNPMRLIKSEGRRQLLVDVSESSRSSDVILPKSFVLSDRRGVFTPMKKEGKPDLLASFIEYEDQIPTTKMSRPKTSSNDGRHIAMSATKSRQSWPKTEPKRSRPSTSPLPKSTRQLGAEKRRSLPAAVELSAQKSYDPSDYDIPSSVLKRRNVFSPKTPESQSRRSQREVGLNKHRLFEHNKGTQSTRRNNLQRAVVNILSTAVKVFSSCCIIARCLTFIGSKRSILYYLAENPAIWAVRFYVLLFHAVLILIEMNVFIPGILPRGTMNNFVHRAFVQSFIGLVDISMNSNRSLVEYDGSEEELEKWVDLAFLVLRVSPRGLLACSLLYFILAVCGKDGRSTIVSPRFTEAIEFDA